MYWEMQGLMGPYYIKLILGDMVYDILPGPKMLSQK